MKDQYMLAFSDEFGAIHIELVKVLDEEIKKRFVYAESIDDVLEFNPPDTVTFLSGLEEGKERLFVKSVIENSTDFKDKKIPIELVQSVIDNSPPNFFEQVTKLDETLKLFESKFESGEIDNYDELDNFIQELYREIELYGLQSVA